MVRGGNVHFFTYTRIRSRETGENRKTNEQTKLGVNQEQRKVCNTTCMFGLSLAWVTSENSTMLLESDILRLFFTGPYLVSSPLSSVSGVDCPYVDPRQPLCSPLSCPAATAFCCLPLCSPATNSSAPVQLPTASLWSLPLSGPRRQLSFSGPATNSPLSCPTTNCLSWSPATNSHSRVQPPTSAVRLSPVQPQLLSRVQPPLLCSCPTTNCLSWVASSTLIRLPVPLPGTARFHVQESFVWFRAKTDNWIVCFGSLPP